MYISIQSSNCPCGSWIELLLDAISSFITSVVPAWFCSSVPVGKADTMGTAANAQRSRICKESLMCMNFFLPPACLIFRPVARITPSGPIRRKILRIFQNHCNKKERFSQGVMAVFRDGLHIRGPLSMIGRRPAV